MMHRVYQCNLGTNQRLTYINPWSKIPFSGFIAILVLNCVMRSDAFSPKI
ncbi:hypothetical protein HanPI659440_Chr10g0377171 [Helianthus annuus]|uniref:Uncharacterized protein n=1 Tax=Helianthus annuus TaxID=4232 RepID=A0A9K3HX81_HELAN|nr:hypothetical protein HanXRQr2_Chr10g0438071 [Helianthus annuus]KAJ0521541.1 hypothetical protein HanIR_Chr10g0472101 [Helianthus annuus]KAJ0700094.1 hypothetical protein HanOQP8_Chr10g0363671 [Helianthus annuus]KAJ0743550.1 hypothetical protein HanPI659440_Chr10g0377171 [Helianthus annuus]KAJ0883558.1 hypothetical protein HanPSC8_Chr10g0422941 [Helianthus annuus]